MVKLNELGFLTINSQPKVNGVPSEDPDVGWGAPGGRVYQKAYLEFFTTKGKLDTLLESIDSLDSISYQAINSSGDFISNLPENCVNAVTWGIFPGQEIVQPTIVDTRSFFIWKDEAFSLWIDDWANIYDAKSESYKLLNEVYNTYYLVNIVDNDFVDGDILKHILGS